MNGRSSIAGITLLLVLLAVATGCGARGVPEYHVSGQVTFGENPVPVGMVRFLPDTARGNRGPAGYARIEKGRYSTARLGRGTVGGPHTVVISGYDVHPDTSAEQAHGIRLFPDYHTTADLPKEATTLDFTVP